MNQRNIGSLSSLSFEYFLCFFKWNFNQITTFDERMVMLHIALPRVRSSSTAAVDQ